jgi:hypothetical protein
MQMWFVELDLVPDFFLRRCIRLLLKIRLISVSVAVGSVSRRSSCTNSLGNAFVAPY